MKAWVCRELTGEAGLHLEDSDIPECGSNQVRVRNNCSALNFPDALVTRGLYQMKLDPPFVPGSEFAGVITAVGSEMGHYRVGQRVMIMCGFGAFSEEVLVTPPMQQIHFIPDSMPFDDAAAFNMTYGTGMHALKQRGGLQASETLLVLGASGGCGSAAVELGLAMGARVIAAASSDEKCALAKRLGAHETVNYGSEPLRDRVMELTAGQGADVIFDPVGGAVYTEAKRCAGWNCRYLVVGFAGGTIPKAELNYTILKSMSFIGVAYGMSAIRDPAMNAGNFAQMFEWYRDGKLKPYIGKRYPFAQLQEACAELYQGKAVGKTVIES